MLREYGFDAIHVSEIGMDRDGDVEILQSARCEGRVCITLDHDFHRYLALTGEGQPSVVLLRVQGFNARS
jgi:predicted nuclease of predicted toxin-antitoxin system